MLGVTYLSGPMSGEDEHNFPAFHAAAKALRDRGHHVINPAETLGSDVGLPRSTYMRIDVGYILVSDRVVVLPGWNRSEGSKLEILLAHNLGIPVYTFDREGPRGLGAQFHVLRTDISTTFTEPKGETIQ